MIFSESKADKILVSNHPVKITSYITTEILDS